MKFRKQVQCLKDKPKPQVSINEAFYQTHYDNKVITANITHFTGAFYQTHYDE